jgi:predicted nucleotidyltransferase
MHALTLDLTPKQLAIVKQILQKYVPQHDVWAFGSRVKNTAKPYSDLDLAVITDHPLSLTVQAKLAEAFTESDLPFRVDIVDWATTSDSFRRIIQNAYCVITGA